MVPDIFILEFFCFIISGKKLSTHLLRQDINNGFSVKEYKEDLRLCFLKILSINFTYIYSTNIYTMTTVFQTLLNFKNFIVVRKLDMRSTLLTDFKVHNTVCYLNICLWSGQSHHIPPLLLKLLAFSSGQLSVIGVKSARNRREILWTGPNLTIGTVFYTGSLKLTHLT